MSFQVIQFPRGLLSLLNVQSGGRAPNLLSEEFIGTIDCSQFFLAQGMIHAVGPAGAPANGFNAGLTIPPNEIWYVYQFAASLELGVGGAGQVAPAVRVNSSNSNIMGMSTAGAASTAVWSQSVSMPMMFPAGTVFGAFLQGTAVIVGAGVNLLYTPLRAGG